MPVTMRTPGVSDAAALADVHVLTSREAHSLPTGYFSRAYVQARRRLWEQFLSNPRDDVSVRVASTAVRSSEFWFDDIEQVDPHAPRITDARMLR